MNRALAILILLAGCSHSAPETPPLAGSSIGGPFALTDQDGRPTTDRSFAGRYRIMYFGYTFCPDACPADLGKIAAAMRLLDKDEPAITAKVVPIFVTVDPARDTSPVVKQFVRAFDPRVVGLTGSPAAIGRVADEYKVYHKLGEPTANGYLVQHTSAAYLMGKAGEPLALLPTDSTPQAVADEIKRWVT